MRSFSCNGHLLSIYLDVIDVDIRGKEREIVDIENCYRQQIEEKFTLDKARRYMYKKKVDRGNANVSGVH